MKKYKPENDKGRKGNDFNRVRETESSVGRTSGYTNGLEQSERRELLQETETNNDREAINSDGQDSKSNRKIKFIRRK